MFGFTQLRCSFCRKKDSQVQKLVAGPRGYTGRRVYICDACVAITVDLMNDSPSDNQPLGEESSLGRKLSHRVRRIMHGASKQRMGLRAQAWKPC